jgi:hypothetical protein
MSRKTIELNIMRRFGIHNRHMPAWVRRFANAAVVAFLALAITTAAVHYLAWPLWLLWLSLPCGIGCMLLNPRKFTLVEGCAGDDGYDELIQDGSDE